MEVSMDQIGDKTMEKDDVFSLKRPENWSKIDTVREMRRALFLKRPFDIGLSFIGIVLSSPIWIILSLLIWLEDRGPIFYKQERISKNGRVFKAIKFRSMIVDAEKEQGPVQATENDPRVTKIGKIMRGTAMDELPQLLNIFKGDMSFVGPRALRPEEKEVLGNGRSVLLRDMPDFEERHSVRPGLTGLAQIFLPADAIRKKKFRYDLFYIRKQSFWLDLKLIFLSFWITFRGKWESGEKKI
jgi:lipopolysaccharide/colanic/teichoic acid biosynthesis glycosyltransferase